VTAFESIKTLADHLEQLAGAFGPVKGLQDQLELLARSFDPVSTCKADSPRSPMRFVIT
jgi:hypothetical protein